MPYYSDLSALPNEVRNSLALHARVIYMNAYNHAWEDKKMQKMASPTDRVKLLPIR